MPDGLMDVQCGDCGAHYQLDPAGNIAGAACDGCGGKRFFRSQPSPTQSDGALRNMVDMDAGGVDRGGNSLGTGTIMSSVPSGICPICGATDSCPHGTLGPHSDEIGVNTQSVLQKTPGAPLDQGTIMGGDGEKPRGFRDNYMHSKVATPYEDIAQLRQGLPQDIQHKIDFMLGHEGPRAVTNYINQLRPKGPPPPQDYPGLGWDSLDDTMGFVGSTVIQKVEMLNMEPYAPLWDESYVPKQSGLIAPLVGDAAGALGGLAMKALPFALPSIMKGVLGGGQGQGQQAGGMAPEQPDPPASMNMLGSADIPFLLLADLETPSSVKSVDEHHDHPEQQDQKEFNDGDDSPSNHKNPNNEDSGTDGEDGVRDATPGYGFGENSPSVERAMMILPLLMHYFQSDESGQHDPIIQGLHEALEQESPGYLDNEHPEGQKYVQIILQNHKSPHQGALGRLRQFEASGLMGPSFRCTNCDSDNTSPQHGNVYKCLNCGSSFVPQEVMGEPQSYSDVTPGTLTFPEQWTHAAGPRHQGGVNAFPSGLPASPMPGGGMQSPGGGTCPVCGGTLAGDGSCPQCGASQHPQGGAMMGAPMGGGNSSASYPPDMGNRMANHQGPVTPQQFDAIRQYLQSKGQTNLMQDVLAHPEDYGWLMSEIQHQPNVAPIVDPSEAQPAPPQGMMGAPGGMPVVDPSQPGGGGGMPMQPMAHRANGVQEQLFHDNAYQPNTDYTDPNSSNYMDPSSPYFDEHKKMWDDYAQGKSWLEQNIGRPKGWTSPYYRENLRLLQQAQEARPYQSAFQKGSPDPGDDAAFGGKPGAAREAYDAMIKEYGADKGEEVYYATRNKHKKSDVNNHVPRCPKCKSATTSLADGVDWDLEGDRRARCHSCQHTWQLGKESRVILADFPTTDNAAQQHEVRPDAGQDPSRTWVDDQGNPLTQGQTYELRTPGYTQPDHVKILYVHPDEIGLKIVGEFGNIATGPDEADFKLTPDKMRLNNYTFTPEGAGDADQNQPMGGMPGLEQIPQSGPTTDQSSSTYPNPGTVSHVLASESVEDEAFEDLCHKCGNTWIEHTASSATTTMHECTRCGTAWETKDTDVGREAHVDLSWIRDDSGDFSSERMAAMQEMAYGSQSRDLKSVAAKDHRLQAIRNVLEHNARTAGRHFTPSEQRALINEKGTARNLEDLDLTNTHYVTRYDPTGRANGMNVPEEHLLLGI